MKETQITTHESLDEILFPVTAVATGELWPDTNFGNHLEQAIFIPEKNKIVHVSGSEYQLVDNDYLIPPVIEKVNEVFGASNCDLKIRSYDDQKFYVSIIAKKKLYQITKDDRVCPMIDIRNSYDGTLKQYVALSFYRLVCSNGMMGFSQEYALQQKHSKRYGKLDLSPLFKDLKNIKRHIDHFKRMTDRQILPDELEEIIVKIKESRTIKYPGKLIPEGALAGS